MAFIHGGSARPGGIDEELRDPEISNVPLANENINESP